MWYQYKERDIELHVIKLVLVRLNPRVIHMSTKYSSKPKEVPIKYNIPISISLNIQFSYSTKLMLDETEWWTSSIVWESYVN